MEYNSELIDLRQVGTGIAAYLALVVLVELLREAYIRFVTLKIRRFGDNLTLMRFRWILRYTTFGIVSGLIVYFAVPFKPTMTPGFQAVASMAFPLLCVFLGVVNWGQMPKSPSD
ncbi:hypothetical protein LBMAG56_40870 [Verrucomicrobiota bacterium]|nr:hypothetical protein LBMAG56_40870 [Verrucomicrobiota bacterium]